MDNIMRVRVAALLIVMLAISGLGLLIWVDWRIALGVWLVNWANNADTGVKNDKRYWRRSAYYE